MDYAEARALLDRLPRFEVKPGLERVARLLEHLDHPERTYPAIHVSGTNGKGSVVAMLDAVLRRAGYRIGRFTSPEVLDFRDRIVIDGVWLAEGGWASGVERIERAIEAMSDRPAQFEAITAIALDAFSRAAVDVAVIEVGLGGRFDATNLVEPVLSVLTNVDLDHTTLLGETPEEIAWEKVGIAKAGAPLLAGTLSEAVLGIAREECAKVGASLEDVNSIELERLPDGEEMARYRVSGDGLPPRIELPLLGGYQAENLRIALRGIQLLRTRGFEVSSGAVAAGLRSVEWPGRFERVRRSPDVILEGAHNVAGARALASDIERYAPEKRRRKLVFGVLADKDVAGMVGVLAPAFSRIVLVESSSPRALPAEELVRYFDETLADIPCYDSVRGALSGELPGASDDDVWVVSGSLTVVAEARCALGGEG